MAVLAPEVFAFDGCWTWFNNPRAAYDASRQILYAAVIRSDGTIMVHSWDFARRVYLMGQPRTSVLEVDDHDNPAIIVLSDGKVLVTYSQHNGSSFSCRSANVGDIRTWDSEVAVSSGNSDSYAHLMQMGDDSSTVIWFFRRGSAGARPQYYRTSTDGGASWNAAVEVITPATDQRPYFTASKTSGSRIDFVVSTGQPNEAANSLYHGYITVASNGALSFFQTDGTAVSSIPFSPTEFTQVYDGTSVDGWQWDQENIGGTPAIVYATFESTDSVHRYYQARWSGSAWQSDEITTGGTTGTADYLYASEPMYSGGVCLDPNDLNTVYVSREYGAGNWRVEKWTHTGTFPSGTWAKADDTSGDTSSVNARPWCVRGYTPTKVLWWSGTYTSYVDYTTQLRVSPAVNWRGAKASSPSWTSGYAPSGARAYYLLHEGSGAPSDVSGNGYHGALVGSPIWNAGAGDDFGAFLSGLSTSAYVEIDELAAALDIANYPLWIARLYKTTSTATAQEWAVAFGRSDDNNPLFGSISNDGSGATHVIAGWRDAAGALVHASAAAAGQNDGEFHVHIAIKEAASMNRSRFDGRQLITEGATSGAVTFNRGALGCLVRASAALGFTGELHAVIVGWGSVPNWEHLAMDLLRGQFQGTFNPDATVPPAMVVNVFRRNIRPRPFAPGLAR